MTVYIKHYITSEADLPKEDFLRYLCFSRKNREVVYYWFNSAEIDLWKEDVAWWLEERELPADEEIDEQIDKYAFRVPYDGSNEFYDEIALKHYQAGINWLKSKLR